MTPQDARRTWRSLEAVHAMIYFTPDAADHYAAAGISHHRSAYFASRAAPMGAVASEVVVATFYNFSPSLVRKAMDSVWQHTTPEAVLQARLAAADTSLSRAFGDELLASEELAGTAQILRRAATAATERPEGRPLFAGHATLPWPREPHLVIWHAQSLLREFRGDGHVASLTTEGLSGLEALVSHAASGDVPPSVLQRTRAWSDEQWADAVAEMATRGLVDDSGEFTAAGRAQRDRIEEATDRLALAPYESVGDAACTQLRAMGKRLTALVMEAGLMGAMARPPLDDD
jgi:hypothetical protein